MFKKKMVDLNVMLFLLYFSSNAAIVNISDFILLTFIDFRKKIVIIPNFWPVGVHKITHYHSPLVMRHAVWSSYTQHCSLALKANLYDQVHFDLIFKESKRSAILRPAPLEHNRLSW